MLSADLVIHAGFPFCAFCVPLIKRFPEFHSSLAAETTIYLNMDKWQADSRVIHMVYQRVWRYTAAVSSVVCVKENQWPMFSMCVCSSWIEKTIDCLRTNDEAVRRLILDNRLIGWNIHENVQ